MMSMSEVAIVMILILLLGTVNLIMFDSISVREGLKLAEGVTTTQFLKKSRKGKVHNNRYKSRYIKEFG